MTEEDSPDHDERIKDFLARHGGLKGNPNHGDGAGGLRGWSEVYAADGFVLRCDWSRSGDHEDRKYYEIPPGTRQ